jgi:hypothetical protein
MTGAAKKPTLAEISAQLEEISSLNEVKLQGLRKAGKDLDTYIENILGEEIPPDQETAGRDSLLKRITDVLGEITTVPVKNSINGRLDIYMQDQKMWVLGRYSHEENLSEDDFAAVKDILKKSGIQYSVEKKDILLSSKPFYSNGETKYDHTYDHRIVLQIDMTQKDLLPKLQKALIETWLRPFQPDTLGDAQRAELTRRAEPTAKEKLFGDLLAKESTRAVDA